MSKINLDRLSTKQLTELTLHIKSDPRVVHNVIVHKNRAALRKQIEEKPWIYPEILASAFEKVVLVKDNKKSDLKENEDEETEWSPSSLCVYDPMKETSPNFDFTHVGLSKGSMEKIVNSIKMFYTYKDHPSLLPVHLRQLSIPIKNYNLLFSGEPGAGKTEAIKCISHKLSKKVILISFADILSQWVGETEKRYRAIRLFAERENAIIFFDEFEAACLDDKYLSKSHEYSCTSQFIKELEDFQGVLLAATNHPDKIAKKVFRRFANHFKFGYLNREGIIHFYNLYLQPILKEKSKGPNLKILQLKNLTPGDFLVCYKRFAFSEDTSPSDVTNELVEISQSKGTLSKTKGGRKC